MENNLATTFSEIVKEEITHNSFNKDEAYFIVLSFIINNGEFVIMGDEKYYLVNTYYLNSLRFIKKLLDELEINLKTEVLKSNIKTAKNKNKWALKITSYEELDKFFNNFQYDISEMNDENKKGFCIGSFLSGGSVSYSQDKSNYHFEIRSKNKKYLEDLQKIFDKLRIKTNLMKYRNIYKIYLKKSELISDILKYFNAIDSLYSFEDFRIKKDFSNSLQRVNNLDVSNIRKTIEASTQQIKWINKILQHYSIEDFDERTRIFIEIRLNEPEVSLEDISRKISEDYDLQIPRTSLNHIVRKLKSIYLKLEDNEQDDYQ